uniref:BTB domain-containing protein n=1 Tax=Kwoniella bestiolae CBS 10118 TaxID=1296100 RepID=A0A1B9GDB9_9TREE|nr:hypothetical protein I302_00509 [Kwoniella bestiolae CBS 10118]OCF29018.1 hypothetical protein I302_00509 [Kwoniella bestiolae CBS 10118]
MSEQEFPPQSSFKSPDIKSINSGSSISTPSSPISKPTKRGAADSIDQTLQEANDKLSKFQASLSPTVKPTLLSPQVKLERSEDDVKSPTETDSSSTRSLTLNLRNDVKLDEKYKDHKGDLLIISSDGVGFKVQSMYVRAASKILNNKYLALFAPEPIKIHLDDPFIERATTIRLFLDFVHGDIPKPTDDILGTFRRAILLAKKYECHLVLEAVKHFARSYKDGGGSFTSKFIFILGANLGDIQLCHDAIMDAETCILGENDGTASPSEWYDYGHDVDTGLELNERDDELDEEYAIDPSTWYAEDIQHVPPRYLVALMRACRVRNDPIDGSWFDVAKKFEKLMAPRPETRDLRPKPRALDNKRDERKGTVKNIKVEKVDLDIKKDVVVKEKPQVTPKSTKRDGETKKPSK